MSSPGRVLTSTQTSLLKRFALEPLFRDFYLAGGTALAAFYLNHRLSDDLDFFTESSLAVPRIRANLPKLARELGFQIRLGRQFETFYECTWMSDQKELIEMDFALDMPGRLAPPLLFKPWGLRIDNLDDIACGKISALYERSEPKDFVDVYVLASRKFSLTRLLRLARQKYPGLDDYGMAAAFLKVKDVTLWPKRLQGWQPQEVKEFFVKHAKILSQGLFNEGGR